MPEENATASLAEDVSTQELNIDDSQPSGEESIAETAQPHGQAAAGDSFTDKIDLNNLPDDWPQEARDAITDAYKNMLRDYHAKNQNRSALERQSQTLQALMADPVISKAVQDRLYGSKDTEPQPPVSRETRQAEEEVDFSTMTDKELNDYYRNMVKSEAQMIAEEKIRAYEEQRRPLDAALSNSAFSAEVLRVKQLMRDRYGDDFQRYAPQIQQELSRVNPQTRNTLIKDLILQGQLERAVDVLYKDHAFPDLLKNADQKALNNLREKKSANLTSSKTPSSVVSDNNLNHNKMSRDELWRAAARLATEQTGYKGE